MLTALSVEAQIDRSLSARRRLCSKRFSFDPHGLATDVGGCWVVETELIISYHDMGMGFSYLLAVVRKLKFLNSNPGYEHAQVDHTRSLVCDL